MKKLILSSLFLSVLFVGCSDDDSQNPVDTALVPVKFSPFMIDMGQTRALKSMWAENDQLPIFSDIAIKKDGTTSALPITYTRGATEGVWNSPSADEQWYFSDAIRQHDFYTYFPAGSATDYTAVQIPDISGQDGTQSVETLKEGHDFMRGTSVATKDMAMASIEMVRVFVIVNLNVHIKQDAFSNNAATLTDVTFTSVNSLPLVNPAPANVATVNLSDGQVACTGGLATYTLHPTNGFALTPTSISIPIMIYPQHSTISVAFTIGGKTSVAQPLSTTNFVGGRVYNYAVEIGAGLENIGVGDPIIFDWISNNGNPIAPIIPNE